MKGRGFVTGLFSGCGLSLLSCVLCGLFVFLCATSAATSIGDSADGSPVHVSGPLTGPAIAIIDISGPIISGRPDPFDSSAVAASGVLIPLIRQAARNADVKVILLRVNTPGGGVVPSDEIYHTLKQTQKPIVVLMGDVAASGGYYISMAAQHIIANPNSLTGSIGVIFQVPEASELLEKLGVKFETIKSGANKDIGSSFRAMREDERALLQKLIDETYGNFVGIVAQGRNLPEAQVRPLADGRIFTGKQALELKLIDALGYEADALRKASELGGLGAEPRVVRYRRMTTFTSLLNEQLTLPWMRGWSPPDLRELLTPSLEYRWTR